MPEDNGNETLINTEIAVMISGVGKGSLRGERPIPASGFIGKEIP